MRDLVYEPLLPIHHRITSLQPSEIVIKEIIMKTSKSRRITIAVLSTINLILVLNECLQLVSSLAVENVSRRDLFRSISTTGVASSCLLSGWGLNPAVAEEREPSIVAILGGGGRTGMEIAQALGRNGIYAVTMTRSGNDPFKIIKLPSEIKSRVSHFPFPVDVRKTDSVRAAIEKSHASSIIFCASASKSGGNAFEVDDESVGNVSRVAESLGLRLVVISALAVDRPLSKSYKVTNNLGGNLEGIMDAKLNGENRVRANMRSDKNYVIIRPGPLMSGRRSQNGAVDIEINQGDMIGGGIGREELADVAVGALVSGKRGVTVEVYRKNTRTRLQPEFDIPTGREGSSLTYIGLFSNVKSDL